MQAFFDNFFNYSLEEKAGFLKDLELYYEDDAQNFDSTHATQGDFCKLGESPALTKRNEWIKSVTKDGTQYSRKVYFCIYPHVDFFDANKYIPPNVDLHLRYGVFIILLNNRY